MPLPQQSPKILSILLRHRDIRAVALVDQQGRVKAQKGQAQSLRAGTQDPTVIISKDSDDSGSKESVYIRRFADTDFLVVVFQEDIDFDAIKADVDETVRLHT